jgi:hypothetical protein
VPRHAGACPSSRSSAPRPGRARRRRRPWRVLLRHETRRLASSADSRSGKPGVGFLARRAREPRSSEELQGEAASPVASPRALAATRSPRPWSPRRVMSSSPCRACCGDTPPPLRSRKTQAAHANRVASFASAGIACAAWNVANSWLSARFPLPQAHCRRPPAEHLGGKRSPRPRGRQRRGRPTTISTSPPRCRQRTPSERRRSRRSS